MIEFRHSNESSGNPVGFKTAVQSGLKQMGLNSVKSRIKTKKAAVLRAA